MAEKSLVQKLRLQGGQRALIANAPTGYVEGLGRLPEGVDVLWDLVRKAGRSHDAGTL